MEGVTHSPIIRKVMVEVGPKHLRDGGRGCSPSTDPVWMTISGGVIHFATQNRSHWAIKSVASPHDLSSVAQEGCPTSHTSPWGEASYHHLQLSPVAQGGYSTPQTSHRGEASDHHMQPTPPTWGGTVWQVGEDPQNYMQFFSSLLIVLKFF